MADGLVRVRQTVAGREEIVRVSTQHVEEYLATHPGSVALDDDWREQAVRAQRAESRATAADKKDEK